MSENKSVEVIKNIMEYTLSGNSLMWNGVLSLYDSEGILSILQKADVENFPKQDVEDIFNFMSNQSHKALIQTPELYDSYFFEDTIKVLATNEHVINLVTNTGSVDNSIELKSNEPLIAVDLKNSSVQSKIREQNIDITKSASDEYS
jgi:hypothetical protein